jgi:hypothetical protein
MTSRRKSKTSTDANRENHSTPRARSLLTNLFDKRNRGLLLDIVVFVLNLFLIRLLTRQFLDLFSQVDDKDPTAKLGIGLIFASMWILPAAGAILKRWSFQQRRDAPTFDTLATKLGGCLFNPLFYFCLNLVISAAVMASLGDFFLGRRALETGGIFVPFIFAILFLTIAQTFFIYRYFSKPKKPPKWDFLRTRRAEALGDVCLFLNMILFQVFWNMLTFADLGHPSGVVEFLGRLFFLCFIALLIYFPPRMFYLAEDINKRRTWLTMLLANSPVIVRVLIGTSSNAAGW